MTYMLNTSVSPSPQRRGQMHRSIRDIIRPPETDAKRFDRRFDLDSVATQAPSDSEFERQKRAFEKIAPESLVQYHGQFVASHDGVILESDNNLQTLSKRFIENHGYIPVYITKVGGKMRVTIPAQLLR